MRISVTAGATIFVVFVCSLLLATDGWFAWESRKALFHQTEIDSSNLARALAQHVEDTIKCADTVLVDVVQRVEVEKQASNSSRSRLHELLKVHTREQPALHGLYVFDNMGRYTVDSQNMTVKPFVNSDREYFVFHQTHADRGPHIGPPVRSRTTGEWIITVSRRINGPDGTFAGVALATIDMEYFRRFHDSFDVGREGAIALYLYDGTVLARRPFVENVLGSNVANNPFFRDHLSKNFVGVSMVLSAVDGVERLYAYRHLDNYPLVVATGHSKREILAGWRADKFARLLGTALIVTIVGLLGYRLIRQIALRSHAEQELRSAQKTLEKLNGNLKSLAEQDGLTGLANRRHFDAVLDLEYRRAKNACSPIAAVMIDVDYFKQYNDIYGHPAGDECLRRIAEVIKSDKNRSSDVSARYGGEEFAVILPNTDLHGAISVAERIRRAVGDLRIEHRGSPEGIVTLSAGVACVFPTDGQAAKELIEIADKGLYSAKERGRNRTDSVEPLLVSQRESHSTATVPVG